MTVHTNHKNGQEQAQRDVRATRLTDQLRAEHERIARALVCLARLSAQLRARGDVHPDAVRALLEFLREYADHDHHAREERVLFPWLAQHGLPPELGPVAVMLHEHDEGRALLRHLFAASKHLQLDANVREEFATHAENYCRLLYEHIDKETNVLFALADRAGEPPEELRAQWTPHPAETARWETVLETLEAEAAGWPDPLVRPRAGCCHGCG